METQSITVLHLDTVKSWRGGQQQAFYLLENMVKQAFRTAVACQPGSEFEKRARAKNLPVHTLPMHGEYDLLAGYRVARLCKTSNYAIIHAHSAHALAIGLWAKLFYRNLILVAARRVDFSIRKNRLSIYKYNNPYLDRIVSISDRIREVMLRDGIPEEKLVTIHSGIDIHKFDGISPDPAFRKNWGIPQDHVIVGTVAAIVGHKDYPNLLKAARIVAEQYEKVTFMAVGNGENEADVLALARKLGLKDRFIFCGYQKEVGLFLKQFDIFVLASRMEGLGTSVLDAQAAGLPVVGTRAGGIPEMIYHEGNGILVPPRNPQALAEALNDLIKHRKKREELAARALKTVRRFDIRHTVSKTVALYRDLLAG